MLYLKYFKYIYIVNYRIQWIYCFYNIYCLYILFILTREELYIVMKEETYVMIFLIIKLQYICIIYGYIIYGYIITIVFWQLYKYQMFIKIKNRLIYSFNSHLIVKITLNPLIFSIQNYFFISNDNEYHKFLRK